MKALDNLKDALTERAAETIAASLTVVLAWAAYQIAPAILLAIKAYCLKKRAIGATGYVSRT